MVVETVPIRRGGLAESVAALLDSAEIVQLITGLEGLRWTGREGYPARSLVGACLARGLYGLPAWSSTARLIGEHPVLQAAIGGCPSVYALYWFAGRLRTHARQQQGPATPPAGSALARRGGWHRRSSCEETKAVGETTTAPTETGKPGSVGQQPGPLWELARRLREAAA